MIIDAHTHLFSQSGKTNSLKPELLVDSLKKAGIDFAVVIANHISSLGGATNNEVIEVCQKYPVLKAVAKISINDLGKDLESAKKYFETGIICGLKLYLGYEDFHPADTRLDPVYKLCEQYKKPIMYHTGVLLTGVQGLLKNSHPLNIDEVALKHPDLKIIMAHTGNPWILDAAAVVAKNPNVYVDVSGYFTEWQPINKIEAVHFLQKFTEFGLFVGGFNKVLFGTDYPLYDQKEYLDVVKRLPLTDEEKELVFWKNAATLFSIADL